MLRLSETSILRELLVANPASDFWKHSNFLALYISINKYLLSDYYVASTLMCWAYSSRKDRLPVSPTAHEMYIVEGESRQ